MEKVSITITTDKPVKISVTPNDSGAEKDGLSRLMQDVKEVAHVVTKRQVLGNAKK